MDHIRTQEIYSTSSGNLGKEGLEFYFLAFMIKKKKPFEELKTKKNFSFLSLHFKAFKLKKKKKKN